MPMNMPMLHRVKTFRVFCAASLLLWRFTASAVPARAQDRSQTTAPSDPSGMLASLLSAACRQNQTQFVTYLTAANAEAFQNLSDDSRLAVVKRFALSDSPGRPLLSSSADSHPVLRCETPGSTTEFHLGTPRMEENLAFIPVQASDGPDTQFGLVREGGKWKLLSLGLVLFDIPQLATQWSAQDLVSRENAVVDALSELADAIRRYQRVFGKLPDTLAQLGPAEKGEVSADAAQLVMADIAAGSHGGYKFRYRIVAASESANALFELAATPEEYGKTGRRSFLLDSAGKVHAADKKGALATTQDPQVNADKTNP